MTGPGEADEEDARPASPRPEGERAPTGWPGRPDPSRFGGATPGSVLPSGQQTGWTTSAPGRPPAERPASERPAAGAPAEPQGPQRQDSQRQDPQRPAPERPAAAAPPPPVRPPVPSGVPPRPAPLPPPRPDRVEAGSSAPEPAVAGSLASATVVPEGVRRPAPRPTVTRTPAARGRRAKLAVKRLDPWSVFVTSLVLSLLLGLITIIAAFVLYAVLSALGVPHSINTNIGDITKNQHILTQGRFVGIAALIAAANVLFLTGLATIGAMLYNVVATFTGGLELTLSERD